MKKNKTKVAVIGTGNIGSDLCERLIADEDFELTTIIGRRETSQGLQKYRNFIPNVGHEGLKSLEESLNYFDGVFDATSAFAHREHWELLQKHGKFVIDLTPSKIGIPSVPVLYDKLPEMREKVGIKGNYSMVTCGGQSSAPMIYAITSNLQQVSNVEVSSSIASKSAGPATRLNIDQYVDTTESLASLISGTSQTKAILVLNPAEPPVMMRTTVHVKGSGIDLSMAIEQSRQMEKLVQSYVPGYEIVVEPHFTDRNTVSATVKVVGAGYFLPQYAGNLDIINAAGVETARQHANDLTSKESS